MQRIFCPTDYEFEWTEDGWYKWDRQAAHKAALKARNTEAKRLKAEGYFINKASLKNQRISKGGIGSEQPHIDLVVNCYMVTAY